MSYLPTYLRTIYIHYYACSTHQTDQTGGGLIWLVWSDRLIRLSEEASDQTTTLLILVSPLT